MKKIYYLLILFIVIGSCKKQTEPLKSAVYIETKLKNISNYIYEAFIVSDDRLIVKTMLSDTTQFFCYSKDLKFINSIVIPGKSSAQSFIENDQTFTTFILKNGITLAYKIDFNFNIIKQVDITNLFQNIAGGVRNWHISTRLNNGDYIIGNTYSLNNSKNFVYAIMDIQDLFGTPAVKWRYSPSQPDNRFMYFMYTGPDDHFYITGENSINHQGFFQQFSSNGNKVFQKDIPSSKPSYYQLKAETDRIIYNNFSNHYIYKTDGSFVDSVSTGNDKAPTSELLENNGYYYYLIDDYQSDGNYAQVRKCDKNLQVIKQKNFGNQNTNRAVYNPFGSDRSERYLLKQSNGNIIILALVANPSLSGTQWVMIKIDGDLNLVD